MTVKVWLYARKGKMMLFISRNLQQDCSAKISTVDMCLVDLEKALDKVPSNA